MGLVNLPDEPGDGRSYNLPLFLGVFWQSALFLFLLRVILSHVSYQRDMADLRFDNAWALRAYHRGSRVGIGSGSKRSEAFLDIHL